MWYLNPKLWAGVILVALIAGFGYLCYDYGKLDSQKEYNLLKEQVNEAHRLAQKQVREIENNLKHDFDKTAQDSRRELNAIQANYTSANAQLGRVQNLYSSALKRISKLTADAERGPGEPSSDPLDLFIDMYSRSERRSVEIGKYADELRVAGLTCERLYDKTKTELDKKKK